jgi:hypothetical protein
MKHATACHDTQEILHSLQSDVLLKCLEETLNTGSMRKEYQNATTPGLAIKCLAIFYHNSLGLKTSVGKYNTTKHSYVVFLLLGDSPAAEF